VGISTGLAKKADFSNGSFRWLTVVSPEEPDGTELQLALNNKPAAKVYQQTIFQQSQSAAGLLTHEAVSENIIVLVSPIRQFRVLQPVDGPRSL
jgi:hypothetical protein